MNAGVLGPGNKTVAVGIEFRLLGQIKEEKQLEKQRSHTKVITA